MLLAACGGGAAPPPTLHNEAPAPAIQPGGLEVTFERTACFGACPTYRVKIHADGRVDWVGGANVRVIGEAHGVADRKKLDQLAVTLDLVKFYARESDGHLGKPAVIVVCTDLPSVRISAVAPGQHNAIDYTGVRRTSISSASSSNSMTSPAPRRGDRLGACGSHSCSSRSARPAGPQRCRSRRRPTSPR